MTSEETKTEDFGRYGRLAIGECRYASITPHHRMLDGRPTSCYVSTFDPAYDALLSRIFDDRDPTATAEVCLIWRGEDGTDGEYFLVRSVSGVHDEVAIPAACVERFLPDVTEEEKDRYDDEAPVVVKQTDFTAIVRGAQ